MKAIFSAWIEAIVLGVISPKIRTKSVRMPVAIPIAAFPKSFCASTVVRAEAALVTILLPIRMVLRNFVFLSSSDRTRPALLEPSSAMDFILSLLRDVNAVSADEKKAESSKRTNNIINRAASPESKISHSLKFFPGLCVNPRLSYSIGNKLRKVNKNFSCKIMTKIV